MKRFVPLCIALFLFILSIDCQGQPDPAFSKPVLILKDGYLIISYNILESKQTDLFHIRIEVTDSNGKFVEPQRITGDIGQNVSGGKSKVIQWNVDADRVPVDQGIFVQVIGERISRQEAEPELSRQRISRMSAVMRSAAFPGWGLSKLNPGTPHWIKGVASYSALASTFILYQRSYVNYQSYLDSSDETERSSLFNKSIRQENLSVMMAYTAAGIWVADLIWTFIGAKPETAPHSAMQLKGISVGTDYERTANIPMLSVRYTF